MSEDCTGPAPAPVPAPAAPKVERLSPALEFAALQTAHFHLNLACVKIEQSIDLLSKVEGMGRLAAELNNVAAWLDDTALRVTGQCMEAARL